MAILPLQLARVSNQLRTSVANQTISRTQAALLRVQNELASGKRLNAPSDDPGDSAIVQQLRKTLEQRAAYIDNLTQGGNHLGEVDTTLGDVSDLLLQAQTLASANVGSDVTADQRKSAAAVVDAIYSQMMSLGNKQFQGVFLFAGDRSTDAPFVVEGGGIKFVGSENTLANTVDENTSLSFMVDGAEVFGALSTRVRGTADLTPALTSATRISDLRGATGDGVRLGPIEISDGSTSAVVDLSSADTVGDVIDAINNSGLGVTASVGTSGLVLTGGAGDDITVQEVGSGTTAADLGILRTTGAGAGLPLNGSSVGPKVTGLTPLSALNGGAGIDLASGMTITNGQLSATVTFTSPPLRSPATVEDLINAINDSGTAVRAQINADGTGIDLLNPTQGTVMTVSENGGTTATDLGLRSFGPDSPLAELNFGNGVRTVSGNDIQITDSLGVAFEVDVDGLNTVQDLIDAINSGATGAGAGVTASFATTGNGIVLSDTAGGLGMLAIAKANFSEAAADLGLTGAAVAGVITGTDVNGVKAEGIFSHLARLRDALHANDQQEITAAAEGLQADYDRVVRIRGEAGARVQEMESRQNRLEDQNLATKALLSALEDSDFTEAISRFQTLQQSLQASLMSSGQMLNLSLLDFLR